LNCEAGPVAEPCGVCESCVELAPNGPGSLDVIELDAATHGLVDDARDLRERAHFAPVRSRFKIYIIDEAHQLGPGAANALLKIIEEPPEHLKFIFATTAPDKILGTIRSRTHHYPFRLVPAGALQHHLASVCEQEGVAAEPAALALVARGGAGSVRDSLSLLGQLVAGAGPEGVTAGLAQDLLGFTDSALLDDLVDALAAEDGGTVFAAVDQVMEAGHDPRRFLTDLLERLRDLILLQAAPEAVRLGLVHVADEQAEHMLAQARLFSRADLVRLAGIADEGLTAMRGGTPTRLQLEIICARLLTPGADGPGADLGVRVDRLERRLAAGVGGGPAAAALGGALGATPDDEVVSPAARALAAAAAGATSGRPPAGPPASQASPATDATGSSVSTPPSARPAAAVPASSEPASPEPASPESASSERTSAEPSVTQPPPAEPSVTEPPSAGLTLAKVRAAWPEILDRLRELKKTPWTFVSQNAAVLAVREDVLTLAVANERLHATLAARDDWTGLLRQAVLDVLGADLRIEAVVDGGASTPPRDGRGPTGAGGAPPGSRRPGTAPTSPARPAAPAPGTSRPPGEEAERPPAASASPAAASGVSRAAAESGAADGQDDAVADGDEVLDDLSGAALLARELGARVIDVVDGS
jgi:DNA polymerase-3 subunit gamma/tau